MNSFIFHFFIFCSLLCSVSSSYAQTTSLSGFITDAETQEPLPYVIIRIKGSNHGTVTDKEGRYQITFTGNFHSAEYNCLGYDPLTKFFTLGQKQTVDIRLNRLSDTQQEIVIKAKKTKYRNKDNPAVAFMQKVIAHKSINHKAQPQYQEFEKYEKITFAVSNISGKLANRKAFSKFQFVFENLDSTSLPGKKVLPVYIKETISKRYERNDPPAEKEKVEAVKKVGFEGYLDTDGIEAYMQQLYQEVDIYDNSVVLFTTRFLSPIAATAPLFYRYYLADTTMLDGTKSVRVNFFPRNKSDLLFKGQMQVSLDSNYAVQKIDMEINDEVNLNWVKEVKIEQKFSKSTDSSYHITSQQLAADFGLSDTKSGLFGLRNVSYKNFNLNIERPDAHYAGESLEVPEDLPSKGETYWDSARHQQLNKTEQRTYATIDSVKKMPVFKRTVNTISFILSGYKQFKIYEVGPFNTFYSFNPVEGLRLRVGGRTTTRFSKKLNFENYVAYGFKDEKYKYFFGIRYSLTKKSIFEFPVRAISATLQRDTKIPGQELQFVQEDNFLLSFKRGTNDKWLYNDILQLSYLHEMRNHLAFTVNYKLWNQVAAGSLRFNKVAYNESASDEKGIQTGEIGLLVRWAPGEKFYQGKTYRSPITRQKPIYVLRFIQGIKGIAGGDYHYQHVSLSFYKRFYSGQLGYTDAAAETGKIFGKLPFPLLFIHRANQTYSYQFQSYNLMNFLEFVSDGYASVHLDHQFMGFFFNKIPLFKKLKWREVVAVKVLYGALSAHNNPGQSKGLLAFPVDRNEVPITYSLAAKPYVEGSVAIANIFKIFRIDLVKRFTYTHHPNISTLGLRGRFRLEF